MMHSTCSPLDREPHTPLPNSARPPRPSLVESTNVESSMEFEREVIRQSSELMERMRAVDKIISSHFGPCVGDVGR